MTDRGGSFIRRTIYAGTIRRDGEVIWVCGHNHDHPEQARHCGNIEIKRRRDHESDEAGALTFPSG